MNTSSRFSQGSDAGESALTIGDLADRTGISPATLRVWEQRHGFPCPTRLESGHRRYAESDVEGVLAVVHRRDAGVRLDVAIEEMTRAAGRAAAPRSPSVYATLRRRHPHLATHQLKKSTLLALSWAIEDEFCAKADRAHIFGAFQTTSRYAPARARWVELGRVATSAFVFADFDQPSTGGKPVEVPLAHDAPMRREWTVVCDSTDLPVALTAWEVPLQSGVPDAKRIFESMWTVEPTAVRDAARVCAQVAGAVAPDRAAPVLYDLASQPATGVADLASVTAMFNRVVAYVDRFGS
ncbi:DICT sensory domain-containing protein [uncultured Nocardioides sp.]|uniref:DICT sensory domain-containing protein n=1 Tax=uncultured Nocardioides sp. TaxID=198441 RepID=UPI0025F6BF7A|nr:DICT sensory domain-containing protein [uncultured Nocardioides sp.]